MYKKHYIYIYIYIVCIRFLRYVLLLGTTSRRAWKGSSNCCVPSLPAFDMLRMLTCCKCLLLRYRWTALTTLRQLHMSHNIRVKFAYVATGGVVGVVVGAIWHVAGFQWFLHVRWRCWCSLRAAWKGQDAMSIPNPCCTCDYGNFVSKIKTNMYRSRGKTSRRRMEAAEKEPKNKNESFDCLSWRAEEFFWDVNLWML